MLTLLKIALYSFIGAIIGMFMGWLVWMPVFINNSDRGALSVVMMMGGVLGVVMGFTVAVG